MGIPYTGSGVMASAIGMDKWRTKLLWRSVGLPIPEFVMLDANSDFAAVEKQLGLPLFVKPACEGSSIGVTKVRQAGELRGAYLEAVKHDPLVIAEKGVLGGEYTASILGDEALPIIKIEPATDFYDYEAKYFRDDTAYRCPCGLPKRASWNPRAGARSLPRARLPRLGAGRFPDGRGRATRIYMLEVNTSPGMTDHSLVPMAARVAGISYEALVMRVLSLATLG
jgi:D-alanine-D-alanine ligase